MVGATLRTGRVGMDEELAEALAAFRRCNYEHIYLRPASVTQGDVGGGDAARPRRALHRPAQPHPRRARAAAAWPAAATAAVSEAVAYVAGMTDRFAMAGASAVVGASGLGPRLGCPHAGVDYLSGR